MFSASSLKFLESFLSASGPSGFEFEQAAVFRRYLASFADTVDVDVMGNSIARINADHPFQVMLAGHYDEIGLQIVSVMDKGLLSFRAVGGIDRMTLPGTQVEILTAKGRVPGVIGRKPIHLQTEDERKNPPEIKNMWIDIGAETKEEAEKTVRIGDPVSFRSNFMRLSKNRIMSKGMDDKIGAFIIAEAFRIISQRRPKVGVACVGTVQEEVGLRGASAGVYSIHPKVGFAVDVGFDTSIPGINASEIGELVIGKGIGLCRNCDNNPVLLSRIMKIGDAKKIPYQAGIGHRTTGGTDTQIMQLARGGVATALFSVPNRYMHTQVEICDLRDAEAAAKLIAETVLSFKGNETFRPGID